MKKIFLFIIISLFTLNLCNTAYAHETIYNGTASVFFHIDPHDDAPVAGELSSIHLTINNKEKGFTIENCDCVLTIGKNGQALLTQKILFDKTYLYILPINFVFPSQGKYDLTVTGNPVTKGLFTPFTVDYDKNVAAGTPSQITITHQNTFPNNILKTLLSILLGVVIGFFGFKYYKSKT